MAKEYVTKSDLDNLEIRITKDSKDDIVKAKEERHKMAAEIQKSLVFIDDLKTESALTQQSIANMEKSMARLEALVIKHIEKEEEQMKQLFEKLDEKYASKLTERIVFGMVGIILVSVFGALIVLVIK